MRKLGRYEIFEEIASGGMATVFLGRLKAVGGFARTVAIKRLHAHYAKDAELRTTLIDEARMASRIHHHNVVAVLDVIDDEGEICIVAEYVHGESLDGLLRSVRKHELAVDPRIACSVVASMLRGLHAAHEAKGETGEALGLVHRDVSPQNILVDVDGLTRVVDFGIAKAVGRLQETRDKAVKGKLAYMAPEQLRQQAVTRRTDIHAAGVVLWETLTARRLFDGDNDGAVVAQVLRGQVPRPSGVSPQIPLEIDGIVARATARDPAARYATAAEMANAIEAAIPLASLSEVGDWVRRVARESIEAREVLLRSLERLPATADDGDTSSPNASQDIAKHTSNAPLSSGSLAVSIKTPRTDAKQRALLILPLLLIVGISVGAMKFRQAAPPTPSASHQADPTGSQSARPEPSGVSSSEPSLRGESSSNPTPEGSATASLTSSPKSPKKVVKAHPPRKTPSGAPSSCVVSSYLDEQGHTQYKTVCGPSS